MSAEIIFVTPEEEPKYNWGNSSGIALLSRSDAGFWSGKFYEEIKQQIMKELGIEVTERTNQELENE